MQAQRAILCGRCQHVANNNYHPDDRRFQTIEPRFLHSDYVPSDIEISKLKDALKEAEQEIERYEEDLAVLRQTLDRIEKAKSAVEITSMKRRAALSAQRRIPAEIWEKIFSILCLSLHKHSIDIAQRYDLAQSESLLLQTPAILISQVCSHWNAITKGTPSIWASIRANIDNPPSNAIIPLQLYLLRSQGYPLDLQIEGGLRYLTGPSRKGLEVWLLLSGNLCRSRKLTVAIGNHDYFQDLTPVQNLTFPDLQSFREGRELPGENTWSWLWQAIQSAPGLTFLSTVHPRSDFMPRTIFLSRLTTWEIQDFDRPGDLKHFLNILPSCTRLNSLTLRKVTQGLHSTFSPHASQDVHVPSLRHLVAYTYADRCDWLSTILQSLLAPSLESCEIILDKLPLPYGLLAMVRQSSPSLQNLEIHSLLRGGTVLSQDSLLFDVLQAASGLAHFHLFLFGMIGSEVETSSDGPYMDDMISTLLLKLKDDPCNFLPRIKTLRLELPHITLDTQLVERSLDMVRARQLTSHPLTDFRLSRLRDTPALEEFVVGSEILQEMQMLEESGIKVVVGDRLI
ncbi:hypothetical protein L218DRAFT_958798 [Marasmius fiardii PR-910]|nr:hypothetical protein L218DRAFT_958798 [Marasmius fiardii PR-910]